MGEGQALAVSAESRPLGCYGDCRSDGCLVGGQELGLSEFVMQSHLDNVVNGG